MFAVTNSSNANYENTVNAFVEKNAPREQKMIKVYLTATCAFAAATLYSCANLLNYRLTTDDTNEPDGINFARSYFLVASPIISTLSTALFASWTKDSINLSNPDNYKKTVFTWGNNAIEAIKNTDPTDRVNFCREIKMAKWDPLKGIANQEYVQRVLDAQDEILAAQKELATLYKENPSETVQRSPLWANKITQLQKREAKALAEYEKCAGRIINQLPDLHEVD